jgi:hypothetical protein
MVAAWPGRSIPVLGLLLLGALPEKGQFCGSARREYERAQRAGGRPLFRVRGPRARRKDWPRRGRCSRDCRRTAATTTSTPSPSRRSMPRGRPRRASRLARSHGGGSVMQAVGGSRPGPSSIRCGGPRLGKLISGWTAHGREGGAMSDVINSVRSLAARYTIERELGSGGMAWSSSAAITKHKRQVAVRSQPELTASLGAAPSEEIETTANLRHPTSCRNSRSGEVRRPLRHAVRRRRVAARAALSARASCRSTTPFASRARWLARVELCPHVASCTATSSRENILFERACGRDGLRHREGCP